ncbi:nucleotide exchange factor GrpE [Thermodesulfobacteriota bacterium]
MAAKKRKVEIRTEKDDPGIEETTTQAVEAGTEEIDHPESDAEKNTGEESTDPLREMESRLESLEQEAKENHDRFLRASAEFENYKKRAAREMNDFRKFANENIVKAMLPVVDNLDRAIESSGDDQKSVSSVVEGVNMTIREILKVFEQFGVMPFESLGESFDPGFHQAVMQEETEDHPDNTVIKELQKGYMIHDRLLRPAMVIVSKKKETESQEAMKK